MQVYIHVRKQQQWHNPETEVVKAVVHIVKVQEVLTLLQYYSSGSSSSLLVLVTVVAGLVQVIVAPGETQ